MSDPTTAQIAEALASALLPLAGPAGLAADGVMSAGLQFLGNLQAQRAAGQSVYTMENLQAAADKTSMDLAQLEKDIGF